MKDFVLALFWTAMTALCWGVYGPLMREGQAAMGQSHLLPFIGVGVAYFVIAVLFSGVVLSTRGEKGSWTTRGTIWSLAAGVITAVGALGIILALTAGGSPIYVMPLVFGCAPVVNTFVTMYMSKTYGQAQPLFYAGLILVIAGAVTVLVFKPLPLKPAVAKTEPAKVQAVEPAVAAAPAEPAKTPPQSTFQSVETKAEVMLFIALTALCWGGYGPLLHRGQVLMGGSRLRPFICVGMAYFLIAVLVPLGLLTVVEDHGHYTLGGGMWSLAGGTAGALGSLGIILAFNAGGKPIYVMPLVFGGAPVVNTLTSIATASNLGPASPMFYAGLIIVLAGAVTVLVFAPKGHAKPPAASAPASPARQPA